MPIQLPDLAEKTYQDIMDETLASIPNYTDRWTNHNPSDPGITILELLSWIAEMTLYRINRMPEESYVNFLRLLAGTSGSEIGIVLQELEENSYLFNWNEVPGSDDNRFREFLVQNFSADWVKTASTRKSSDGKTVNMSDRTNFISLTLNDEKTRANLTISNVGTIEFTVKVEDSRVKVYKDSNTDRARIKLLEFLREIESGSKKSIVEIKAEAMDFLNSHYRAVTEEDFCALSMEATENEEGVKVDRVIVFELPEKVEVIIVSRTPDKYPELVEKVSRYLHPRRLIGTRVEVKAPEYTKVDIKVGIICDLHANASAVIENVKNRIVGHLDPITGGADKKGWEYNRPLTTFEIDHIVEDTDGVERAVYVDFKTDNNLVTVKGLIDIKKQNVEVIQEKET